MCLQVTYTLLCEHVRTRIIYCAAAQVVPSPPPSRASRGSSSRHHHYYGSSSPSGNDSSADIDYQQLPPDRRPCKNLAQQSLPYPTPPSFQRDPATAAASPLAPKCPLADCPFEAKKRCWNCCWCGKGWNEQGRCGCVMIIDGSEVRCEHICCSTCEAAEL